jgi:type IV pilus assembly protein PilB
MKERERLGKLLVDSKLLTEEQLKMAIDFQKAVGGKLGAIIVKLGFIEDHTLIQFIAKQMNMPVVNLDELVLPENLVKRIPRKLIEKHHVIPIHYKDGVLTVATSDPFDFEAIEELQLAQDARIEIHLASRNQIQKCISQLFYQAEEPSTAVVKEKSKDELLKDLEHKPEKLSKAQQLEALVPLLVEKGVISYDELAKKAKELWRT